MNESILSSIVVGDTVLSMEFDVPLVLNDMICEWTDFLDDRFQAVVLDVIRIGYVEEIYLDGDRSPISPPVKK